MLMKKHLNRLLKKKTEEAKQEPSKEPPKEEVKEQPKEDEQFKNKTDRMKNKKVKCEGCQAEMTLKTLRYSHKCNGKTEDKPIKPKPKARTVAIKFIQHKENDKNAQNIQNNHNVQNDVIQYSEPVEVKTKPKPVKIEEAPPPRQLTARELLEASYNEIRKAKQQEKQEKINRFKLSMF